MTATVHIGIRDAIVAAYQAASGVTAVVTSARIRGNRDLALASDAPSDIQVLRVRSEAQEPQLVGVPIDWVTTLRTRIRAREESTADAAAAACFAALMADVTLGGLVGYLVPESFEWSQDEADENVCAVDFDIRVQHRANASNTVT